MDQNKKDNALVTLAQFANANMPSTSDLWYPSVSAALRVADKVEKDGSGIS